MAYTRRNIGDLGDPWAPEILWYARGVKAMQGLGLDKTNGWRFWGAIHGFHQGLWEELDQWSAAETQPSPNDVDLFWEQCQHGSWYFLPWHRGYLIAFEAQVRAAIRHWNGPADTWALPYWNYFKAGQNALPQAFATPDWPDGNDNPLHVKQRYGPDNDGNVYVDLNDVNLKALTDDPTFIGARTGTPPGFGGPRTPFMHGGGAHGGLEFQPHDQVHGLVGGGDQATPGMMSIPQSAALDPIFWLHHCNIDRLWQIWAGIATNKGNPHDKLDPVQKQWLDGPKGIGQRAFVLPMPDGSPWKFTPEDMTNPASLDYSYDDITPPAIKPQINLRLERFGLHADEADALVKEFAAVPEPAEAELLGASLGSVPIVGKTASAKVALRPAVQNNFVASLAAPFAARVPDRVYLNLENITGLNDAALFRVYIDLPEGADPDRHPELKAGSIGLFGVSSASNPDGGHAGEGLSFSFDISPVLDTLHLDHNLGADQLNVTIVARNPVSEEAKIRIGRISLYRQDG